MSAVNPIEAMLAGLRRAFLDELPARCDDIEHLVLQLEGVKAHQETFNELYRKVHSLKGSGGTHGLGIVTAICHHLENLLTETAGRLGAEGTDAALAHVDLLRRVVEEGEAGHAAVEEALAVLRQRALKDRRAVLLADSSRVILGMYQRTFAHLPLQLSTVDDGMEALQLLLRQPFDAVVLARELKGLNGLAVAAALRASLGRNADARVILVSSNRKEVPAHLGIEAVLPRDQHLAERLARLLAAPGGATA